MTLFRFSPPRGSYFALGVAWLSVTAACLSSPVAAQTLVSPALKEAKPTKSTAVPVTLYASSEPDPALRYRFWPAPERRTGENPMPFVSRAIVLVLQNQNDKASRAEFAEGYDKWSEMPLDELPVKEVEAFLAKFGGSALGELGRAENFMSLEYDLHLDELSASEMIQTLLPEYQEMRQLARLLQLRARIAVAERRWDDAVRDLRVGFRLGEIAGHSTDFLIGRLIGFAISSVMMDVAMEAIQLPDCPNFYWALACLPGDRLFETRNSIEFESVLMSRLIPDSGPLPDHPIGAEASREQIRLLADQAATTLAYSGSQATEKFNAQLLSGFYVVSMADESRELLATSTPWGDAAYELSAPEAVLRASQLRFARIRDEWVKWSLLPATEWREYADERQSAVNGPRRKADMLAAVVHMLTPAVDAARRAGLRTRQTRNLLSSLEALRMHAAETGELPKSIEGLRPVPFWNDGIALKPFGYHRDTPTTATLTRAERWSGDPETSFRITLKKGT